MIITPLFRSFYRPVFVAAAVGLLAVTVQAQSLVSHYTLDGVGTDSGSIDVDGTLAGSAAYTTNGSGVGIFNEALSTADGTNDFFTAATGGNSALSGNALTVALWVNIASGSANDRLVSNITGSSGIDLFLGSYSAGTGAGGADAFALTFGINGTSGGNGVSSADAQYITGKWLFIAVTYDAANVRFYSGSETVGLVLNDTVAKTGSIASSVSALEIGGTPVTTNDRSSVALFNDVRIYNGVLTDVQLEAIRAGAVIPEPSQYAMIFGLLSVGGIAMARNRGQR